MGSIKIQVQKNVVQKNSDTRKFGQKKLAPKMFLSENYWLHCDPKTLWLKKGLIYIEKIKKKSGGGRGVGWLVG